MPRIKHRLFDFDEDDESNKSVKKFKKNDLINVSQTSEMPQLLNTLKAIAKHGF